LLRGTAALNGGTGRRFRGAPAQLARKTHWPRFRSFPPISPGDWSRTAHIGGKGESVGPIGEAMELWVATPGRGKYVDVEHRGPDSRELFLSLFPPFPAVLPLPSLRSYGDNHGQRPPLPVETERPVPPVSMAPAAPLAASRTLPFRKGQHLPNNFPLTGGPLLCHPLARSRSRHTPARAIVAPPSHSSMLNMSAWQSQGTARDPL
jgi:hypothetical protein